MEKKLENKIELCPFRLDCVSKTKEDCTEYKDRCMVYDFYLEQQRGKK